MVRRSGVPILRVSMVYIATSQVNHEAHVQTIWLVCMSFVCVCVNLTLCMLGKNFSRRHFEIFS